MIEATAGNGATQSYAAPAKPQKVLKMIRNERMGGSVPAWVAAESPASAIEGTLGKAQHARAPEEGTAHDSGLAYSGTVQTEPGQSGDEFGFGDLLDMVNPLQHIPVVNTLYRELTGDTIKPISKLIGGGIFGGPVGVAGGLVNLAIEEETGRDLTGNAFAFVLKGETPHYRHKAVKPETQIAQALDSTQNAAYQDLPVALLSFSDVGTKTPAPKALHNDSRRYNS